MRANTDETLADAVRDQAKKQASKNWNNLRWGIWICWFFILAGGGAWMFLYVAPVQTLWEPHMMFWPVLMLVPVLPLLERRRKRTAASVQRIQEGRIQGVEAFWSGYDDLSGSMLAVQVPNALPLLAAGDIGRRPKLGEVKPGPAFQAWLFSWGDVDESSDENVSIFWPGVLFQGRLLPAKTREERLRAGKRRFMWLMLFLLLVVVWGGGGLLLLKTLEKITDLEERQRLARTSSQWPTVTGRVVDSSLRTVRIGKGRTSIRGWDVDVSYVYTVNGRLFRGNRLAFCADPQRRKSVARARQQQFSPGAEIAVHHESQRPAVSVLLPGGSKRCFQDIQVERFYVDYLAPGIWIVGKGLILWAVLRKRRQFHKLKEQGWF